MLEIQIEDYRGQIAELKRQNEKKLMLRSHRMMQLSWSCVSRITSVAK